MKPWNMLYFSQFGEIKHLMPRVNQLIMVKKNSRFMHFGYINSIMKCE